MENGISKPKSEHGGSHCSWVSFSDQRYNFFLNYQYILITGPNDTSSSTQHHWITFFPDSYLSSYTEHPDFSHPNVLIQFSYPMSSYNTSQDYTNITINQTTKCKVSIFCPQNIFHSRCAKYYLRKSGNSFPLCGQQFDIQLGSLVSVHIYSILGFAFCSSFQILCFDYVEHVYSLKIEPYKEIYQESLTPIQVSSKPLPLTNYR